MAVIEPYVSGGDFSSQLQVKGLEKGAGTFFKFMQIQGIGAQNSRGTRRRRSASGGGLLGRQEVASQNHIHTGRHDLCCESPGSHTVEAAPASHVSTPDSPARGRKECRTHQSEPGVRSATQGLRVPTPLAGLKTPLASALQACRWPGLKWL